MWNRQQVKEQAKQIMKRNYWKMFVVTLIASILTGEKTTIIERVQDFTSNNLSYDSQPIFYSSNFELIFYSFISVASILGILYTIFIGNIIVVGKNGYFIKNHDENPELGEIFKGFKGNYLNVVKIMFLMDLDTFNKLGYKAKINTHTTSCINLFLDIYLYSEYRLIYC